MIYRRIGGRRLGRRLRFLFWGLVKGGGIEEGIRGGWGF